MMIIRPIAADDYDRLYELAEKTGPGFTSLQPNEKLVRNRLEKSLVAFAKEVKEPGEESYLFVLEDTENDRVAGICGIMAGVGLSEPWYNYRLGTLMHSSRELNVHNIVNTLSITNDHTGCSEICTLFLDPDYRHSKNGSLLSKSRFLFMAEFPQRFAETVIAEMRGISDKDGISPFWEGLGRHFFSIDFSKADYLTGIGEKVFIAELMPKHLIYTNLLPKSAQEVIGKVHENTLPALKMLEAEGFRYEGYMDIFDAGPTITARFDEIRAIRESHYVKIRISEEAHHQSGELHLISNTSLENFRCCMSPITQDKQNLIYITPTVAASLQVEEGDSVRVVPLSSGRRV
ncbi:arginine N-succinyltransferase [Spartinivicinus poritis]|uniref:Arginine N-succinyltransferase n=1 Tax=Spartinivicinus poritis TaxID=2994640 RepID=A0ABT5UBW4_9GAMM|nr:arginine N-succinyltransferase [Spartinivicinus sp. A2-2]MDE1463870.1 arginine N-succinyltransferase [Spartinivicinus sp. A2-2]